MQTIANHHIIDYSHTFTIWILYFNFNFDLIKLLITPANSSGSLSPSQSCKFVDQRTSESTQSEFEKNVLDRMVSVFIDRNVAVPTDPGSDTDTLLRDRRASQTTSKLSTSIPSNIQRRSIRPIGNQTQRKTSNPTQRFGGVWQSKILSWALHCCPTVKFPYWGNGFVLSLRFMSYIPPQCQ